MLSDTSRVGHDVFLIAGPREGYLSHVRSREVLEPFIVANKRQMQSLKQLVYRIVDLIKKNELTLWLCKNFNINR